MRDMLSSCLAPQSVLISTPQRVGVGHDTWSNDKFVKPNTDDYPVTYTNRRF